MTMVTSVVRLKKRTGRCLLERFARLWERVVVSYLFLAGPWSPTLVGGINGATVFARDVYKDVGPAVTFQAIAAAFAAQDVSSAVPNQVVRPASAEEDVVIVVPDEDVPDDEGGSWPALIREPGRLGFQDCKEHRGEHIRPLMGFLRSQCHIDRLQRIGKSLLPQGEGSDGGNLMKRFGDDFDPLTPFLGERAG